MQRTPSALWRSLPPGALFALVVAVYAPAVDGGFIYDDHRLILEQPVPHSPADFVRIFGERHWHNLPYYRPVTRSTMLLQKLLHGDDPAPYHLFNVVLMGLAGVLAYALLRLPVFGVRPVPAWIGAGLFALHPAASSVVYPICSGRETLLPAVLILAAVYAFLRGGPRGYAVAMVTFAVSLLSQERAIVVPGVFALADALGLTPDAPGRNARRWIRRYLPAALIVAGYLLIRFQLFGGEQHHRVTFLYRPLDPLASLLYALQTAFAPFYELVYEPRTAVWAAPGRQLVWLAAVGLMAVVARRHWTALRPAVLFWLGWSGLALLPTANLLLQEARFAERYVFLALLGGIGVAGALASTAWHRPAARRGMAGAGAMLLLGCAGVSLHRAVYFRDDAAFLEQWVRTDPRSVQAQFTLGDYFVRDGKLEEAIQYYGRALKLSPNRAEIHANLALALRRRGRHAEALQHQRRALQLDPYAALSPDR